MFAHRAGVLGAHGDEDPKLCRNDVQALGAVLANAHHLRAAARALRAVGFDDLLDPGQGLGKVADVALGRTGLLERSRGRGGRRCLLNVRQDAFEIFGRELELVAMELLGLLAVDERRLPQNDTRSAASC